MKRKAKPAQAATPQLDLFLGQPEAARDLAYYIGLCKLFAAHYKRWPGFEATRDEFRAARIADYDGRRIDRELRFPGPELEADPAYRALRERCRADGMGTGPDGADDGAVTLAALDPRYRTILQADDIAALFDSIALPGRSGADAPRYATGAPAHAQGELTLNLGEALRARALRQAGLDPDDPAVLTQAFSVRVRATEALKAIIERIGVRHLHGLDRLADFYRLDAGDGGRLDIRYQVLAGARYAGRFDVDDLVGRLTTLYAADADLAPLRARAPAAPEFTPPSMPPSAAHAAAPGSAEELRGQLATLTADGERLALPIQRLSRFDEIRRMLERAGALYLDQAQGFEFESDVDAAAQLRRLLSGDAA